MEYVWRRTPFLRIIIPFIIGIYLVDQLALPIAFCFSFALSVFLFSFYCPLSLPYRWRQIYSLLSVALLISLGMLANTRHVFHHPASYLTICSWPKEKAKSYSFLSKTSEGELIKTTLLKTACPAAPQLGERFLLKEKIVPIEPSKHQFGFQAEQYYHRQNIHRQCFINHREDYQFTGIRILTWNQYPLIWREKLIQKLYEQPISSESKGVLAALILGYSDDIDEDLMQSYSQAGVVHVLAVSGLHVGLIYLLLNPIFALLGKKRWAKNLRLWIPFLLLWIYAAITGFSPSVMRAAVMFSFFLVAERFEKNPNGLNTLCASAFFLLLFDSSLLFNIGFQLSYLAVLGILIFDKPIRHLFFIRNKWLRKGWELIAVSLAAQLTTTPISLYYFHQFPTYFLAANIVLVPLSTLILYAGLSFYALLFYPPAATWVIRLTAMLTEWMNSIGQSIGHWPGSLIKIAAMSTAQLWLLLILLCAFGWVFLKRSKKAFFILLLLPIAWPFFQKKPFPPTLLCIRKHNAILIHENNELIIASDSAFQGDSSVQKYTINPLLAELNATPRFITLDDGIGLLWTKNHRLIPYRPNHRLASHEKAIVLLYAWDKNHFFTEEEWSELACHTVWICNEWSKKKQALIAREITARGGKVLLEESGDIQLSCLPSS